MLKHRRTFFYICFLFLILFASPCVAEEVGFNVEGLKDLASGAALNRYFSPQYLTLPGTNIKAGIVGYSFHNPDPADLDHTYKVMFMIDNKTIYYVGEDGIDETKTYSRFDVGGDCIYGVYKDYFTVACMEFGASNPARKMFLFRYGKDKVELLDFINGGELFSFIIETDFDFDIDKHKNESAELPMAKEFRDVDGDGVTEILLTARRGGGREDYEYFPIYLEIVNDRLRVDLNPKLYEPFFEQERKEYLQTGQKSDAYYVTGFLSGKLSIDKIEALMSDAKKARDVVMYLLERIGNRDESLISYGTDENGKAYKPVLKHYDIKWR